jgi:hypothetical protein
MSSTRSNLTIDQRGIPSNECINCGSNIQVIRAIFSDYELVMWFLDSFCAGCGSPMTAPTPVDNPDYKEGDDDDLY